MTKQELAQALYDAFVTDKRDDGTEFVKLKDDRAEWMQEAVMAAHGDMGPDDTRYSMITECTNLLIGHDDWSDCTAEIADSLVDIYNAARLKWLASHLDRAGYCDEAQEEGLVVEDTGMFQRIGIGQYMEYKEILHSLISSIEAQEESDNG